MINKDDTSRGRFIVFEGIDGSGKSTQIQILSQRLRSHGTPVYETREPTDSPIGSLIHQIMTGRIQSDHSTIAALFVADRLDHLQNEVNGILRKVESGMTVLADRYYFSSFAYHGVHVPMDWVVDANSLSAKLLRADLTLFIDVDPNRCSQRLKNDRWHLELYEETENMAKVREKYFEAFEQYAGDENIVVIDGNRSPEAVSLDIWNAVAPAFNESIV